MQTSVRRIGSDTGFGVAGCLFSCGEFSRSGEPLSAIDPEIS